MRTAWRARRPPGRPRQGPQCGGGLPPGNRKFPKPKTPFFSGPLSGVTAIERLTLLLFGDLGSVDGVRQKADLKLRPATSHQEVSRFERFASLVQLERDLAKKKNHVEPLLLLCGGAFAASVESGVTKGKHLVYSQANLGFHAACVDRLKHRLPAERRARLSGAATSLRC